MPDNTELDLNRYSEDGVSRDLRGLPHHVPLIISAWPRWNYITAIVIGDPDEKFYGDIYSVPADDELAMVASFHEQYINYWYQSAAWLTRMRAEHPFDVDAGAVGRYVCKYRHGGWGIRLRTWAHSPWPRSDEEPLTLVQVLDDHFRIGSDYPDARWIEWKSQHPEIFGGQ